MQDPRIAVLIPVFNEELVIAGTIKALTSADVDKRDIYIVDDKSTDKTAEIARAAGVNVFTVPQNGGKARAQTAALAHFNLCEKYDWIIFLDGDTEVDLHFYNAMYARAKQDSSIALYVGQVTSARNNHVYAAARCYEYSFSHEISKKGQDNFSVVYVAPGCTSMYRTDVLEKLHIDPMTLAEDMDLTIQVHRLGEQVKYVDEAKVVTQDPNNFRDYTKQVLRWFRGFWQIILKHGVFSFSKKNRVDFYMIFVALDALILNRVFMISMALLSLPLNLVLLGILADFGVFIAIGGGIAIWKKRSEVFWKAPVFYWLSYVNLYALLRAFAEVVVLRKTILDWNKVKRYSFDSMKGGI